MLCPLDPISWKSISRPIDLVRELIEAQPITTLRQLGCIFSGRQRSQRNIRSSQRYPHDPPNLTTNQTQSWGWKHHVSVYRYHDTTTCMQPGEKVSGNCMAAYCHRRSDRCFQVEWDQLSRFTSWTPLVIIKTLVMFWVYSCLGYHAWRNLLISGRDSCMSQCPVYIWPEKWACAWDVLANL